MTFEEEYERGFVDGMQQQMKSSVDRAVNAATKKKWVGLTDEDKNQIAKEAYNKVELTAWELAQRVGEFTEVKLKEKNGY